MTRFAPLALAGALALVACSDSVVEPQGFDAPDAALEARAPAPGTDAIATIAINAGFDELVGALVYVDGELDTGLVDLFLNGTDQYTVFAPTNEAFENLYGLLSAVLGADIDGITAVPAEVVLDVLLYHVTEGRRAANSVLPRRGVRTITPLLGETFQVRTNGTIRDGLTGVRESDAAIVAADISASNGIIHVISEVIVPPSIVAALTGN
jgi:uncharacterized surface protein with fasciclin (FAS1) repeats